MSLLEICLLCLCAWVATASVIALVFCLRLKRDNERAAMQCKFDPMSCKGIERGDMVADVLRAKPAPGIKPTIKSIVSAP